MPDSRSTKSRYIVNPIVEIRGLVLFSLTVVVSGAGAAPPSVTALFPSGGKAGTTVAITSSGTLANWPVTAWANHPGIKITAEKGKSKFKAELKADVPPGIYLVRFMDKEGASSLRPFIVSGTNELIEKEPNETIDQLKPIGNATVVNGKLEKSADVDCFLIEAKKGQSIVASLTANQCLASPMDAVLQICDEKGFVLAQNDDNRGLDPLAHLIAPADGKYMVRLFAFPETPNSTIGFSSSSGYIYRLTVTNQSFLDFVLPMASSGKPKQKALVHGWNLGDRNIELVKADDAYSHAATGSAAGWCVVPTTKHANIVATADSGPKKPQAIQLPAVISGVIESPHDADTFQFVAKKGAKFRFAVAGREIGFPIDPYIQVRGADRKVLADSDDAGRSVRDPVLSFTAKSDGPHLLEIRDLHRHGGPRFAYRIEATNGPSVKLTTAADHFVVKPGASVDVDVKIARIDGYTEAIEVTAVDLPPGVTAKAVTSPGKGKTAAAVKLKITAAKDCKATHVELQIRGKDKSGINFARFAVPKTSLSTHRLWLSVVK